MNYKNYKNYKKARDKAWEVLLLAGIGELPVSVSKIARFYNIPICKYTDNIDYIENNNLTEYTKKDGFVIDNQIFFNDKLSNKQIRFVIAHELGHILLSHIFDDYTELEHQANVFASRILMPICVLNELNLSKTKEISEICNVSEYSANIRLQRLNMLRKRNKFFSSNLEKKVFEKFKRYIEQNKPTLKE